MRYGALVDLYAAPKSVSTLKTAAPPPPRCYSPPPPPRPPAILVEVISCKWEISSCTALRTFPATSARFSNAVTNVSSSDDAEEGTRGKPLIVLTRTGSRPKQSLCKYVTYLPRTRERISGIMGTPPGRKDGTY